MKYFDITPVISEKIAVFPGDVSYQRRISLDFDLGHHLQLSSLTSTFHLGAHADSSSHYHSEGQGVEARPLAPYFGNCQVISVQLPAKARIGIRDLHCEIKAPRVLFRTMSFSNPEVWKDDFNSLSPELIHFLKMQNVQLVGLDTPSVDPSDSKALESHQALFETGMAVLEGLLLNQVPDGVYQLVALPLPFQAADASPVRAILIENPSSFPKGDLKLNSN